MWTLSRSRPGWRCCAANPTNTPAGCTGWSAGATACWPEDKALDALLAEYPGLDVQTLRTHIRNARREQADNKPPKSYRVISRCSKTSSPSRAALPASRSDGMRTRTRLSMNQTLQNRPGVDQRPRQPARRKGQSARLAQAHETTLLKALPADPPTLD